MGSYAEFRIGTNYIGATKNDIDPLLLSLFQENDKKIYKKSVADYAELHHNYAFQYLEYDEQVTIVQYVCSASVLRDRLELMGFTVDVAKIGFEKGLAEEITRYEELGCGLDENSINETVSVLCMITCEQWYKYILEIVRYGKNGSELSSLQLYDNSPILKYMLSSEWYGFPHDDHRHMIRLLVEACEDNDEFVYDLTDFILSDWAEDEEDLTSYVDEVIMTNYDASRRTIIITEGHSDTWIIKRSLTLLYPHIKNYFHFIDFEGAKIAGGAGALANIVKIFAGAGIVNRIIALFDNDTAAEVALRSLHTLSLPDNISVLRYPEIDIARYYPTLGPSGIAYMDVNGLAGSIELYLGTDILSNSDNSLTPVQWKGYDVNAKKYQGEVLNKEELHKRIDEKLSICEKDEAVIKQYDWKGIRAIINEICKAFQKKDAEELLSDEDSY